MGRKNRDREGILLSKKWFLLYSEKPEALKSLSLFTCHMLHGQDWLTPTVIPAPSFAHECVHTHNMQTGGPVIPLRDEETGELTHWTGRFMNCFQKKGWGIFKFLEKHIFSHWYNSNRTEHSHAGIFQTFSTSQVKRRPSGQSGTLF